jgi:glycosyltransferase involved in cell wall biosynthesis
VRIVIVNAHGNDPTVGGVEKGLAMLTRELSARGHAVSWIIAFPGGRPEAGMDITVLHNTSWRTDSTRRLHDHVNAFVSRPTARLSEVIADHRPDLVHTHNLPGITTAIWEVARRQGLPVLHTLHDYYLLCPRTTLTQRDGITPCRPHPLLCGLRTRRLSRWSSAVSHVSGVSRYLLGVHEHLFPKASKHLIRNPMVPLSNRSLPPPARELRSIGYIGSLDEAKGVSVLLEAAPELVRLGCRLHLAGGGRLAGQVEQAAEGLPNVQYHGIVSGPAKEDFFAGCDLGIIPSTWAEPGGPTHTMIEWLCAGRPLLVSPRGGLGEIVGHYPGAVAVEPTVEAIRTAVSGLRDRTSWQELVDSVRLTDVEDDLARWASAYETVYRSMT